MSRKFSTLVVFTMFVIAIGLCIGQTIKLQDALGTGLTAALLGIQALIILGIAGLAFRLLSSPANRGSYKGYGAARPLRRLISAVWS